MKFATIRYIVAGFLSLWGILLAAPGAIAAESVVLRYRIFQASVPVSDLTTLAETGEASPELASYLRRAGRSPEELKQILTREVSVNPQLFSRILNSPIGNVALDQLGQSIHTPSRSADRQALRAALQLSTADDGSMSLIELIQNYPTQQVHVDGDRVVTAINDIQSIQERVGDLFRGRLPF